MSETFLPGDLIRFKLTLLARPEPRDVLKISRHKPLKERFEFGSIGMIISSCHINDEQNRYVFCLSCDGSNVIGWAIVPQPSELWFERV